MANPTRRTKVDAMKSESNADSPKGAFHDAVTGKEPPKWMVHDIPLYVQELLKHDGPVVMVHQISRRVGRTYRER